MKSDRGSNNDSDASTRVTILQLSGRLEDASSNERLVAIQSLHTLAKTHAKLVGECALTKLMEILREHGSVDEYQDVLDLATRLVTTKDRTIASSNVDIILSDKRNIELLLDMLEHDDLTIGVLASQLLTEMHGVSASTLESSLQQYPDGMNKLLRRLPDRNREEVRDQALGLIQQLTRNNEEMKKTFAFNEGFEIIFKIIESEGGAQEASVVVQDCLLICYNVLSDSPTCQRLFFGLAKECIQILESFFDPKILDEPMRADDDSDVSYWYDNPLKVSCSSLAAATLAAALSITNSAHQQIFLTSFSSTLSSCTQWIARGGPAQLINHCLELLNNIIENNPAAAALISSKSFLVRKISLPNEVDILKYTLTFGSKVANETTYVTLPLVLCERYVQGIAAWNIDNFTNQTKNLRSRFDSSTEDGASVAYLRVIESWLGASSESADLLIQYVLAPPPPLPSDDDVYVDDIPQVGQTILALVVEGCSKIGQGSSGNFPVLSRAANLLSVIFSNSSPVGRELSTALSTSHVGSMHETTRPQLLLPLILSSTGRAARFPGGQGYPIIVALLRTLASVCSGCQRATRQLFEDPSNLFVVDLATQGSENAGVPSVVQLAASFFIGCCFQSLHDNDDTKFKRGGSDNILSAHSFISMIDSKIGLQRFTDILRRPIQSSREGLEEYFFSSLGFRKLYEAQVESIRIGIFNHFAGTSGAVAGLSASSYDEIIALQKERITELEEEVRNKDIAVATISSPPLVHDDNESIIKDLRDKLSAAEVELTEAQRIIQDQADHMYHLESQNKSLRENSVRDYSEEVHVLKQHIISLTESSERFSESIIQKEKKVELLQNELNSHVSTELQKEKQIHELELRNGELKKQTWTLESELSELRERFSETNGIQNSNEWKTFVVVVGEVFKSLQESPQSPGNAQDMFSFRKETYFNHEVSLESHLLSLSRVLQTCLECVGEVADKCSDIIQSLPSMKDKSLTFASNEQSCGRVFECFNILHDTLNEFEFSLNEYKIIANDADSEKESVIRQNERLEEYNRQITEENQQLIKKMENLNSTNEKLLNEISEAKSKGGLEDLQQEMAQERFQLETKLIAVEGDLQGKIVEIQTLKSELERLAELSTEKDELISRLRSELSDTSSRIQIIEGEFKNQQVLAQRQIEEIASLQYENEAITQLKSQINDRDEEIQQLRGSLVDLENNFRVQLEQNSSIASEREETLIRKFQDLKTKIATIEEDYKHNIVEQQSREADLLEQCRSLEDENKVQVAKIQKILDDSHLLRSQLDSAASDARQSQSIIASLNDQISNYHHVDQELKNLIDSSDLRHIIGDHSVLDSVRLLIEHYHENERQISHLLAEISRRGDEEFRLQQALAYSEKANQALKSELEVNSKSLSASSHNVVDGLRKQLQKEKIRTSSLQESLNNHIDAFEFVRVELKTLLGSMCNTFGVEMRSFEDDMEITDGFAVIKEGLIKIHADHQEIVEQFDDQAKTLDDLRLQLESLRLQALNRDLVLTPAKDPRSSHNDRLFTPAASLAEDVFGRERTEKSQDRLFSSSKKSYMSSNAAAPQAKEIAHLFAELSRERRKLHALQEEHNDLLGLLAQQELELSIFRDALEDVAGMEKVMASEDLAQRATIDRYGSYINFRRVFDNQEFEDDSAFIDSVNKIVVDP